QLRLPCGVLTTTVPRLRALGVTRRTPSAAAIAIAVCECESRFRDWLGRVRAKSPGRFQRLPRLTALRLGRALPAIELLQADLAVPVQRRLCPASAQHIRP